MKYYKKFPYYQNFIDIIISYIISEIENSRCFRNHLSVFLSHFLLRPDPSCSTLTYLRFALPYFCLLISSFLAGFFASPRTRTRAYEACAWYKSNAVPRIPSVAKDRSAFRIAIRFSEDDNGRCFNRSLQNVCGSSRSISRSSYNIQLFLS